MTNLFRSLCVAAFAAGISCSAAYAAALSQGENSDYPEIIGSIVYSDAWVGQEAPDYGLYYVPTSDDTDFSLMIPTKVYANYGAAVKDGVYYFNYYYTVLGISNTFESYGVNLDTGEVVYYYNTGNAPIMAQGGMDTDPLTNEIYGIFFDKSLSALELATIKYGSGAPVKTPVASLGSDNYVGFVIASDGTFYAIQVDKKTKEGVFGTMDRTTGKFTKIGNTGQYPAYLAGACIDRRTDRIFWSLAPSDETGYLVEIDKTTGQTTLVKQFENNEEVAGLWVPVVNAPAKAPGYCTGVNVDFKEDSLNGTISFTAPVASFDGTPLTNPVNISILIDGKKVKTLSEISAGASAEADITVDATGRHTFSVYASNGEGDGPKTNLRNIWIGADIPLATTASASYNDGEMKIEWSPVTEGINKGYLDLENLTYTVKNSDGQVIASELKSTSYNIKMTVPEILTVFYYTVEVVCNGNTSAPARTNNVVLGAIVPPYNADFTQDFAGWTVIDSNNDGITWTLQPEGYMRIKFSDKIDMDDWLITPAIKLEAGKKYEVKFAVGCRKDFPEKIEVKWGEGNSEAELDTVLVEPTVIEENYRDGGKEFTEFISPEHDGNYYIGFHGITEPDQYYLYLLSLSISPTSGVSEINDDSDSGETRYYNIQGIEVNNPTSGLYIVKKGSAIKKVIIP